MDEPIITFGSESLILETHPELKKEPVPEPTPEPPEPVKRWCIIS